MRRALPWWPLLLVVACQEAVLTGTNRPPDATIIAPGDGARLFEGHALLFEGTVSDPDHRPGQLSVTWHLDERAICPGAVPDDRGRVTCATTVPAGRDRVTVTLVATDARGASGSASASYDVEETGAPSARIVAPQAGAALYVDRPVTLRAEVADAEDGPTELVVAWTSDRDGALAGGGTAPDSGGVVVGASRLSEGEHLLAVVVTDASGKTGRDAVTVVVGPPNRPPACAIRAPAPGAASAEGAQLALEAEVSDPDVPPEALTVTWTSDRDGVVGSSTPTSSGEVVLVTTALSVGTHVLLLEVTDDAGAPCTDAVVHHVGRPPGLVVVSPARDAVFRAGAPIVFEALLSHDHTLPPDLDVRWSTDVAGTLSTTPADDAGVATFVRSDLAPGPHVLEVRVTDPAGLSVTRARGFSVNRPPGAPGVVLTPTPARTRDTLVAVLTAGADDPDGHPVTYGWSWRRDGVLQPAHTGAALPPSATRKHETWTVRATPHDGFHHGDAAEASLTVLNTPPEVAGLVLTPAGLPRAGTTLTCAATAADADADPLAETVTWTAEDGSWLASGPAWTVPGGGAAPPGSAVTCTVRVTDDDGAADEASVTVTVGNSAPVVGAVAITPAADVTARSTLTCAATASDPDGGVPTVAYAWLRGDGTLLGAGSTLVLTPGLVAPGDLVRCRVTATDAEGASAVGEDTVVVVDGTPSVDAVLISVVGGGPARAGSTLHCSWSGFRDPQGDPDRSRLAWTVDGALVGDAPTLAGAFVRDQTVTCTVTPSDGLFDGAARSDAVRVEDTPPSLDRVVIRPQRPILADTLTCDHEGFGDADGDADASRRAWRVDGVDLARDAPTLAGLFSAGSTVSCTVTPTTPDGTQGTPRSDTVRINRPPGPFALAIHPERPGALHDLACVVATPAVDPDGDPLTYDLQWRRDGLPTELGVSGLTASEPLELPSSATAHGQTWTCVGRAFDGVEYGPEASVTVSIGCPEGSGHGPACAGATCRSILLAGEAWHDRPYWIDPAGSGAPYEAWCDMTTDGGGWTLVLQAASRSALTYDAPFWTATSGGRQVAIDPAVDEDAVSRAYYELEAIETRLCLPRFDDGAWVCELVTHAATTPRDLASGPPLVTFPAQGGMLTPTLRSIAPASTWVALGFQRWGWNHGTSVCGGVRIGFSSDGDTTDSRDSAIGIGFHFYETSCNPLRHSGFAWGSGFYHFPWSGHPVPKAAALPARVWVR